MKMNDYKKLLLQQIVYLLGKISVVFSDNYADFFAKKPQDSFLFGFAFAGPGTGLINRVNC